MSFPLGSALKVFAAAIAIYFIAFGIIEHVRHRNGAWQVTFLTDSSGTPSIRIDEAKLGIQGVVIRFPGEHHTNANVQVSVTFDLPLRPVPFGTRVFEDLTFLPGGETLDLFGHEIELAPRTLVINRKEKAWSSGQTFEPPASEKIPPEQRERKRKRGG